MIMSEPERLEQARKLENNPLLNEILKQREAELIAKWRMATTLPDREQTWHALRQLDLLAGAIEDAIRSTLG